MTMSLVGLLAIPIIVKPIDNLVEYVFNKSIRNFYCIGSKMQEHNVIRHKRNLFYGGMNEAERDLIEGRRR